MTFTETAIIVVMIAVCLVYVLKKDGERFEAGNIISILASKARNVPPFRKPYPFPRVIWTFWNSEKLPPFAAACVDTWREWAPNFKIVIVTPETVSKYLPELDWDYVKGKLDNPAHQSDFVRTYLLASHGGVWFDATIALFEPLEWIVRVFDDRSVNAWFPSSLERRNGRLLLENWAFACLPQSPIVVACLEMMKSLMRDGKGANERSYLAWREMTQDIGDINNTYLWQHWLFSMAVEKNPKLTEGVVTEHASKNGFWLDYSVINYSMSTVGLSAITQKNESIADVDIPKFWTSGSRFAKFIRSGAGIREKCPKEGSLLRKLLPTFKPGCDSLPSG